MKLKASVSLCMIVKNEEKYIEKCLLSVKDIVNEIIIVDTGSTDETIKIAEKYTNKIYSFIWDDNFSDARNFSIKKATKDWILLLDADEEFEKSDTQKFIEFINTTKTHGCHFAIYNYIGEAVSNNYTVHNAFRLLKNNKLYHFESEIHEQIRRKDGKKIENGIFDVKDIRLHHYGYLDGVVKEKDKRKRNIPILLKKLEQEPTNSFTLFNLGNEYLALKDYTEALNLYNKAYSYIDITQAYAPHLIYRRAMCLYTLRQYNLAIKVAIEGLNIYPLCTDLEYLKGTIYFGLKKYTLAIDSFDKCIEMGEPPSTLKFMDFCATTRPLISKGELYYKLEEYEKALDSYTKAFNIDNSIYQNLYIIGDILNKMFEDKSLVAEKLTKYFSSLDYVPNLVVITDILINQKLYDTALVYVDKMKTIDGYDVDKTFLEAKLNFCNNKYDNAYKLFDSIVKSQKKTNMILPNIQGESSKFVFVIALIKFPKKLYSCLNLVKLNCDCVTFKIYYIAHNIYKGKEETEISKEYDINIVLNIITDLLDKVLKVKEFSLFEKILYIYNYMDCKSVLINLAEIYYSNGYNELAYKQVLRSIKELDFINSSGLDILNKSHCFIS